VSRSSAVMLTEPEAMDTWSLIGVLTENSGIVFSFGGA